MKEIKTRREFFKQAAKEALPFIAGIVLLQIPMVSKASTSTGCEGCFGYCTGCQFSCEGRCNGKCKGCEGDCKGSCYGTCRGRCEKSSDW